MEEFKLKPIRRYEYKYLVPTERVGQLREAVEPYCRLDKHGASSSDGSYSISSLYFDTPDYLTYWTKKHRHLERFKLRVRTYGEQSEGPVFFEVKRKVDDVIIKDRYWVDRNSWRELIESGEAEWGDQAHSFLYRLRSLGARPSVLVRYRREAWVGIYDQYSRFTLDHHIIVQPPAGLDLNGDPSAWRGVDHPQDTNYYRSLIVLELKFPSLIPSWMVSLVRRFQLLRRGFSKYCNGIDAVAGSMAAGRETIRHSPYMRRDTYDQALTVPRMAHG